MNLALDSAVRMVPYAFAKAHGALLLDVSADCATVCLREGRRVVAVWPGFRDKIHGLAVDTDDHQLLVRRQPHARGAQRALMLFKYVEKILFAREHPL